MNQQIQASTPSPVSPAAAPAVQDQGSVGYPQWVPQAATPVAASVPTAQPPSQVAPATDPTISNQYNPSTYQSSPSSNPWEQAMGSLERVLSQVNSQSLSQTPQSPYLEAPAQVTPQSNQVLQAQPWAYQEPQVAPISNISASPTQTSSQVSTGQSAGISPVTAEVVSHFGIEAPGILNQYSCSLEDLLIDQGTKMDNLAARHDAMQVILTDPDHLANYTDRFFTEVFPVDVDENALQTQGTQQPQAYEQNYDMPAPPVGAGGSNNSVAPQQQWEQFQNTMNRSPENAWRILNNMGSDALRNKLLFMDPS